MVIAFHKRPPTKDQQYIPAHSTKDINEHSSLLGSSFQILCPSFYSIFLSTSYYQDPLKVPLQEM